MSGFTSGMRTSNTAEWTTPKELFDELDAEFHFDLDVASTHENALCERHYTAEEDGLSQPWDGNVWCNPPYGRVIGEWVRKAAEKDRGGGRCMPRPCEDGPEVVAGMGRGKGDGGKVRKRKAQIRRFGQQRTVSERNRDLRQAP